MFIFFDTETTGLPKNWNAPITDLENWPRVIEICWIVKDINFNTISEHTHLIKPDNWFMKDLPYWENLGFTKEQVLADKDKKFWTENNFTNKQNEEEGLPMGEVLEMFIKDYDSCVYMVAHNINYDFNVLGAEFLRYGMKTNKKLFKICTMKSTVDFVKAPFPNGGRGFKWPTLTELHLKLFGKGFDSAHSADADVKAGFDCLHELLKRRVMYLPIMQDNRLKSISLKDLRDEIDLYNLREMKRNAQNENNIDFNNKDYTEDE